MVGILIVTIGCVFTTIGDVILRYWMESRSFTTYAWGIGCYFIGMNFLAQSFRYKNIVVASVMFIIINIAMLLVVTRVVFVDQLRVMHWWGLALGLLSVVVLELAR